jgi:transcriptional regulator with XRE-family HTH domain
MTERSNRFHTGRAGLVVGNRVQELLMYTELSCSEIERRAGLGPNVLTQLRNDPSRVPQEETARAIGQVLGVPWESVLAQQDWSIG